MKRTLLLLIGSLLLIPKSWADDAKAPADQASYLEQLQLKLDHAAQRANQPSTEGSSVIGLRGSKQESGSRQLYWKGKAGVAPVSTAEIIELRTAIEKARAGNNDGAIASLKTFLEKHPKSALKNDAEQTLKIISPAAAVPASVAASPVPVAPAPAVPPAAKP